MDIDLVLKAGFSYSSGYREKSVGNTVLEEKKSNYHFQQRPIEIQYIFLDVAITALVTAFLVKIL